MPLFKYDHDRLLTAARVRHNAKMDKDWLKGIEAANECIVIRGSTVDFCWLAYFYQQLGKFDEALKAINQACHQDDWRHNSSSNHRAFQSARLFRSMLTKQKKEHVYQVDGPLIVGSPLKNPTQERNDGLFASEPSDPYFGLHELAVEEVGGSRSSSWSPEVVWPGSERHSSTHMANSWINNQYSGYGGSEEQDVESNDYDPYDSIDSE